MESRKRRGACRLPIVSSRTAISRGSATIGNRARRSAVSSSIHYGNYHLVGLDYRLVSNPSQPTALPLGVLSTRARTTQHFSAFVACMYECACVRVCMCVCMCTYTYVYSRAYMWYERRCKRKRNKATLSWLRLVCCRHEVPVTSEPITVIHMDEDVVVVNKPASIPVSGVLPELYCQKKLFVVLSGTESTHTRYTHVLSLACSCRQLSESQSKLLDA